MDGVDQERAAAFLGVPLHVEVLVRLRDGVVRLDAHDLAQLARIDDLAKQLVAVRGAAMVPNQKRCTCIFADLDDVLSFLNGVCDGLLEQDVLNACCKC